jgi:hypothetical protein
MRVRNCIHQSPTQGCLESKSCYDGWPIGQSVLVANTHLWSERLSRQQGHSAAGRIRSIEKFPLIGTSTRDLPACSRVPQPTTLLRAPNICIIYNILLKCRDNGITQHHMITPRWKHCPMQAENIRERKVNVEIYIT